MVKGNPCKAKIRLSIHPLSVEIEQARAQGEKKNTTTYESSKWLGWLARGLKGESRSQIRVEAHGWMEVGMD